MEEEVGVGNLRGIFEALSQRSPHMRDTETLCELVRHALSRQITAKFARGPHTLRVFLLDHALEMLVKEAIHDTSAGSYLALPPASSKDILAAVRASIGPLGGHSAGVPILVSAADVRRFVRRLVSLEFPALHVLSRQEIQPDMPIEIVARIDLARMGEPTTPAHQG